MPLGLIAGGLLLRLILAPLRFLDPDEALHYELSAQPSFADAYRVSLTTVHPPLYILFLHLWGKLGHSEFFLRLPSVLAAVAFSWIMYRWLERAQDRATALACLSLLLFLPSLVSLSTEVRQYALLLLFCSAALYFLDHAIQENSWRVMILSALSLSLALFTHYSGFIFALALGIYAITRLVSSRSRAALVVVWSLGQLGVIAIVAFLYKTHISKLQAAGTPQLIADSWLRIWAFHPGQAQPIHFAFHNTIRLFRYIFSHGTIGVLGLVLVIWGLVCLLKQRSDPAERTPKPLELAFLFSIPFVIILAAAIAAKYPYGGTRHDALLAMFAIPAASIGLAQLPGTKALKVSALAIGVLVSNMFAVPSPPNMPLRDQKRKNMQEAIEYLRETAPRGATIFADHSAGLLLSYYLCHHTVVPFQPLAQEFRRPDCSGYELVTLVQQPWGFEASTLPFQLETIQQSYRLPAGSKLWLFQAGWIDSNDPQWLAALKQAGCPSPQRFGANILVCELTI